MRLCDGKLLLVLKMVRIRCFVPWYGCTFTHPANFEVKKDEMVKIIGQQSSNNNYPQLFLYIFDSHLICKSSTTTKQLALLEFDSKLEEIHKEVRQPASRTSSL